MQLSEYVRQVEDQLRGAAALGDERTQQVAATLTATADASVRLAVFGAVSATADEITAALLDADLPGSPSVGVALDGDVVRVHVALAPAEHDAERGHADGSDATARVSLRLPETLKGDVERAAARDSVSVNTWLVRAASSALSARGAAGRPGSPTSTGRGAHRITGWVIG